MLGSCENIWSPPIVPNHAKRCADVTTRSCVGWVWKGRHEDISGKIGDSVGISHDRY